MARPERYPVAISIMEKWKASLAVMKVSGCRLPPSVLLLELIGMFNMATFIAVNVDKICSE